MAGIAGSGSSISNCCAMVRIKEAAAFSGAIAGKVDESGIVENNFFVSNEIAGIDRISYSGKAEPVSYKQMLDIEDLPDKFRTMTIVFYADEEEVKTMECPYGAEVTSDMYPNISLKEGFYADWDIKELKNVVQDEDVTVEYVRYLTTIASEQTRRNAQSVILADGIFKKDAILKADALNIDDIILEDVEEHWNISFPDDGNDSHQIRYQAPQGQTKGVTIYLKQGGEWLKADTEFMGFYYLFTVDGSEAEIAVCIREKALEDYLIYIIPVIIAILVVTISIGRKVKRKKVAKRTEKAEFEEL